MDQLRDKTLIMLISPTAMGKSTIIQTAAASDRRFSHVRGFTTRAPRSNDAPRQFYYFTPGQLDEKRAAGEVITEVTFPTNNQAYGTISESYAGEYCMLETLSNGVQAYRDLPFDRTIAVSVTSHADTWRQRFTERYPRPTSEAIERLEEARLSLLWSLAQVSDHYWLTNDEPVQQVANELIALSLGKSKGRDGRAEARECLAAARSMW